VTAVLPKVAVVGRQNVGKSTLVNRLFGRRETIADEMPGVTRDRVEVQTTWGDRTFALVDTGGYTRITRGIESLVAGQADRAAAEADLILLIVDAQAVGTWAFHCHILSHAESQMGMFGMVTALVLATPGARCGNVTLSMLVLRKIPEILTPEM
jgi:small GTP-binding protein